MQFLSDTDSNIEGPRKRSPSSCDIDIILSPDAPVGATPKSIKYHSPWPFNIDMTTLQNTPVAPMPTPIKYHAATPNAKEYHGQRGRWPKSPQTSEVNAFNPPAHSSSSSLLNKNCPPTSNATSRSVLQPVLKVRKTWKTLRDEECVWPVDLEAALLEGRLFIR
jgi:hypothetical protein